MVVVSVWAPLQPCAMADCGESLVLHTLSENGDPDQAGGQEHQTHREEQRPQQVRDISHLGEVEQGQGCARSKQQHANTDDHDGL